MKFNFRGKFEQKKLRMPLSVYLTYLLVATFIFTGVSFSQYASSVSGSSSAQVAYVVTDITGEAKTNTSINSIGEGVINGHLDLDAFEFEVTVTNQQDELVSEVAMGYTIYVKLSEGFPIDSVDIRVDGMVPGGNSTETLLIFEMPDILPAGVATTKTHLVTVTHDYYTTGTYKNQGLGITVTAEQID